MKNLALFIFVFSIFFTSCTKEPSGYTRTYLKNTSGYNIKMKIYQDGQLKEDEIVMLHPAENKEVLGMSVRGKTLEPCWGTVLRPYDSVVVTFDNMYSVKHKRFNDTSSCYKCILYESDFHFRLD